MQATAAATFCATLVDEWVRLGVEHAVFAPGSRSTPMLLALDDDERIELHRFHDERVAGFAALGIGKATGVPAVVLTTSGTAAVELHPAVVEASYDRVPLIACTADRPPELHDVGAPQTIDQQSLYGSSCRLFVDPGVPDDTDPAGWRDVAREAHAAAVGRPPGPVQVNLPFREPLLGIPGPLPPLGRAPEPGPPPDLPAAVVDEVAGSVRGRRGVIVAGGHVGDAAPVLALGRRLGWPVFADPRSGCRVPDPVVVAHFDGLLRCQSPPRADVGCILRLGSAPASKVLGQWLADVDAEQVGVDPDGWRFDVDGTLDRLVAAPPDRLCAALADRLEPGDDESWLDRWRAWDDAAEAAIVDVLADIEGESEPDIARQVVESAPDGGALVVASSMPIRDVEWFAPRRDRLRVLANRGANGIDGVLSTAVGVALTGMPVVVLLGDLAFLHDRNALIGLAERGLDLRVVVVDNDGGGIFSFLPPAVELEGSRYERLFGTPHGGAVLGVDGVAGVEVHRTDRETNLGLHQVLQAAIAAAVG